MAPSVLPRKGLSFNLRGLPGLFDVRHSTLPVESPSSGTMDTEWQVVKVRQRRRHKPGGMDRGRLCGEMEREEWKGGRGAECDTLTVAFVHFD